jgi:hypothetical protein
MRYSVDVPNFGEFAAPEVFAEVARRAEAAGWDALLVWDHVVERKALRREIADPWILLTAAALATRRIRLGTAITPVARRRPAKLAREVATLDRLTGGRMILGVGLGAPVDDEYASFGDTTDPRVLAQPRLRSTCRRGSGTSGRDGHAVTSDEKLDLKLSLPVELEERLSPSHPSRPAVHPRAAY